jgi:hypothetical protein
MFVKTEKKEQTNSIQFLHLFRQKKDETTIDKQRNEMMTKLMML